MAEDDSFHANWDVGGRRALGEVLRELDRGRRSSSGRSIRGGYDGRGAPGIEEALRAIESLDLSGISAEDLCAYRGMVSKGWQGYRVRVGEYDDADQLRLELINRWIIDVAIVKGEGPLASLPWHLPHSLSDAEIVYGALNKKLIDCLGLNPVAEEIKAPSS